MTPLNIECLTKIPLDYSTVSQIYERIFNRGYEGSVAISRLIEVILSHERLRVECEGAANLLNDMKEKNEKLQANVRLLHDATIVLRNGMGGHNHWDHTMKHGAGCLVCIQQREARDRADELLDEVHP